MVRIANLSQNERLLHFGWVKLTKTPFERSLSLPSVASLARLAFHRFWEPARGLSLRPLAGSQVL